MMSQIWRRLQLLAGQGVATLVSHQRVQATVLDGETLKAQRVEPYGLSYRPKPGAQVYLVFPAGDRAQGIALVVGDRRYEMQLQEGEVALHDDEGNHIKLGRGGHITMQAAGSVSINTPGACSITSASLTHNGINVGHTHTHAGQPSAPPGPVAPTGAPRP